MSVKLFFQNYTTRELSSQALENALSRQDVAVHSYIYTLQSTLSALKKGEPTCIVCFESAEEKPINVTLMHSSSVTQPALEAIRNAVSSPESNLLSEDSVVMEADIVCSFEVSAFRIAGHQKESEDTVYSLQIVKLIEDEHGNASTLVTGTSTLSKDQAIELDQLNPGTWGEVRTGENLRVLTGSALYSALMDLQLKFSTSF